MDYIAENGCLIRQVLYDEECCKDERHHARQLGEMVIYATPDGTMQTEVRLEG